MLFLSAQDLIDLTGYVRASAQRAWLARHGMQFWVRADGKPAVPAEQFNQKTRSAAKEKWAPDLSLMDRHR